MDIISEVFIYLCLLIYTDRYQVFKKEEQEWDLRSGDNDLSSIGGIIQGEGTGKW
jgi:hypothetical protein